MDEIAEIKNSDYERSKQIIEIVKEFVIARRLIVYGGLALDRALRLKGSKIYRDGELMDIDVYTDDSVKNAYDLVDILRAHGYRKVAAIRAIHVQTMKVRVDFINVCDISYLPSAYYSKLPTLDYNGLRILHPHVQFMDVHFSFSFPYGEEPFENIFNRWDKDLKRYNMTMELYPIEAKPYSGKWIEKTFDFEIPESIKIYAVHGFTALAFIRYAYSKVLEIKAGSAGGANSGNTALGFSNNKIKYSVPEEFADELPCITTPYPLDIEQHYYPTYSYQTTPTLNIYSTEHSQLSISSMTINKKTFLISSIHYVMFYFLNRYFREQNKTFLEIYKSLYDMILHVCELMNTSATDNTSFIKSPFSLSVNVMSSSYGDSRDNSSSAYIVKIAKSIRATQDWKSYPDYIDKRVETALKNIPNEYYPDDARDGEPQVVAVQPALFDYSSSKYFT